MNSNGRNRTVSTILSTLIALVVICCVSCSEQAKLPSTEIVLLGPQNEQGWVHVGEGGFNFADGVVTSYGGHGVLVYTKRAFSDFRLKLEFKQDTLKADSGVFLRIPYPKGEEWLHGARNWYQVELGPVMNGSNQGMAAIDNLAVPIDDVPVKPAGQWNDMEVSCIGRDYKVYLNGQLVTTFTGDDRSKGYIGVQNHDKTSIAHFRNIRVVQVQP